MNVLLTDDVGGGLASDEVTLGLPISSNQLMDFEAQLNQLLVFYGIEMVSRLIHHTHKRFPYPGPYMALFPFSRDHIRPHSPSQGTIYGSGAQPFSAAGH